MKTRLLQEDDCAPDAREYFEKDFLKITEMSLREFKILAFRQSPDDGYTETWTLGDFFLTHAADSPWYELYKIVNPTQAEGTP